MSGIDRKRAVASFAAVGVIFVVAARRTLSRFSLRTSADGEALVSSYSRIGYTMNLEQKLERVVTAIAVASLAIVAVTTLVAYALGHLSGGG